MSPRAPIPQKRTSPPLPWWLPPALVAAVFVAYLPALGGGFIWDDERHVTAPALRSLDGLGRIWTQLGATQQYYPLLHSVFWLQHTLWGDAAIGYHATNIGLHALVALLFAAVLIRLKIPGAGLAAWLFALHPVHVESVAWISEQKNTLSTAFYLGAALLYLRFDDHRRFRNYVIALLLFMAALLTKTVTATLPAALLVVLWWKRGRLTWREVGPLVPWLFIGAAAGLLTAWVERNLIGAEGAAFELSLAERSLLAGRVVWFYLGKLAWPAHLTFIYPRWIVDAAEFSQWLPLAAVLSVALLLWRRPQSDQRAPLAVLLLFAGSLFPVLGFFNVYPFVYSFVADHFQYLASLGVIAFASASLLRLGKTGTVLGIATAVALAALTSQQSAMYRDVRTLYRTTLVRNPGCWMAHNNLGKELLTTKATVPEAIACFERALVLRPAYFEAHNNLGLALAQNGRPREGLPHLEAATRLKPRAHEAHNNLGIALAGSGRAEDALRAFQAAAEITPGLPNIHENWAKALLLLGRNAEAEARFTHAANLRAAAAAESRRRR